MRPGLTLAGACALLSTLLVVILSGCGSSSSSGNGLDSKSPAQIVAAAKAAAAGAASAHVAGSIVDEGKPISLDMELLAGKGGKGKLTLNGLSINLVQVNGAVYMNGSTAFYKQVAGDAAAQLLQGKWLKAPSSDSNFASLAQLTDLNKLIGTTLASHGKLTTAGSKTIAGQKTVGVTDATKGGTLYVASTGTAFPIEIAKTGASGGTITFDHWNKPVTLSAPTNAINIDQLKSGR